MKETFIWGSSVIPISKRLKHGCYITDSYVFIRPKYPHFRLEEHGGLIGGRMRLLVVNGPDLPPTPILEALTKTGDRRAVMEAAKELAQNDDPVPLHTVDLLDLANRVAEGEIS